MELMYPIVIIVFMILAIIIFFVNFNKNKNYISGKKVANTKFIKETEYYKNKIKKYKILVNLVKCLSVISILFSSILIARPITIGIQSEDKYNRDVLLSIDVSDSQYQVNLEMVKKFRSMIKDIKGDRIGIVLFNTAPIVYCPLTDDYEYIDNCLQVLEKQLSEVERNDGYVPYASENSDAQKLFRGGVVANSDERGSSLIGDGLAGTIFSFPDLKTDTDRTRIIVFATDNDLAGKETISLKDACTMCSKYNINIYGYCPTEEMNSLVTKDGLNEYKKAIENNAKGKFYTGNLDKATSSIVNEIKETKTTLLKTSKKTYVTDHPQIFFIITMVAFVGLIILEKRIKL